MWDKRTTVSRKLGTVKSTKRSDGYTWYYFYPAKAGNTTITVVAKDKLSTAIYNMYGIYDEANASSLIMSFSAVPADCKINPKDEIFNPITSVMNDEMTVEEWAQNVEDAFAQVRADQEAAK